MIEEHHGKRRLCMFQSVEQRGEETRREESSRRELRIFDSDSGSGSGYLAVKKNKQMQNPPLSPFR